MFNIRITRLHLITKLNGFKSGDIVEINKIATKGISGDRWYLTACGKTIPAWGTVVIKEQKAVVD